MRPSSIERLRGRALQKRRRDYFTDNPLCAECQRNGRIKPAQELDHITPLFKGGSDEPDNWQGLCFVCHQRKSIEERGDEYRQKPIIGADGWPR